MSYYLELLYFLPRGHPMTTWTGRGHKVDSRWSKNAYTVAEYNWSIANNFIIDVYCRCLEILCQVALSGIANYFRSYRKKQFGIKSIGIYSRHQ